MKIAAKELGNVKVNITYNTKVKGVAQLPDGRHELSLSNGEKLITDVYIPTMGVIPNSSYVPSNFLNEKGFVSVDEYLKVRGTENVWAIGDVSDVERPAFITCSNQSTYLAKSLLLILAGKLPVPYKLSALGSKFISVLVVFDTC